MVASDRTLGKISYDSKLFKSKFTLAIGGFYGSTDKHGPLLRKKVDMLKEEGVEFETEDNESNNAKVSTTSIFTF